MKNRSAPADSARPTVACVTHRGKVRGDNEDCIAADEAQGLYVLADGMGGHEGGEIASHVAVESIIRNVSSGAGLEYAIVMANEAVIAAGRRAGVPDMGTTVVALQVREHHYRLAWVGDSRAYRLDEGVEQLSDDHTVVSRMLARGEIGEPEARTHSMRNLLTHALGRAELDRADIGTASGSIRPGQYILLSSDGLHDLLDDDEIHALVAEAGEVQPAVDSLLQAVLARGGTDNVSMILLRCRGASA